MTGVGCMFRAMLKRRDMATLQKPDRAEAWRERIKADLVAQVEAGGTLYGYCEDGAYIARTKNGDRVIIPVAHKGA